MQQAANNMDTTANGVAQLEAAFAAFSKISGSLESAYGRLEQRVSELSAQLANERSKRLAELNAKEQLANRLSLIMNLLPGGIVVLDEAGEIQEANTQVIRWFGEDCVGMAWDQVVSDGTAGTGDPNLLLLKSGARISVSHQPTADAPGTILLLADVTTTFDTYEQSSREARLVALGEMAARLAHQIRTPLSSALLGLSNAGINNITPADRLRALGRVSERLRHIESLVSSMLSFVRGKEAPATINRLAVLLHEAVSILAPTATLRNGRVRLTLMQAEDVRVRVRREEFVSVLVAIAENGLFLVDDPEIEITVDTAGGQVFVDVSDNGTGITAEDQQRLFEPFYSNRANGTGLGLAIAARFARESGGSLGLLQTGERGSTFRLALPLISRGAPCDGRLHEN